MKKKPRKKKINEKKKKISRKENKYLKYKYTLLPDNPQLENLKNHVFPRVIYKPPVRK